MLIVTEKEQQKHIIGIILLSDYPLMIAWYLFLRKLGYSRIRSLDYALYNYKRWYPEGEWPYKMKKRG